MKGTSNRDKGNEAAPACCVWAPSAALLGLFALCPPLQYIDGQLRSVLPPNRTRRVPAATPSSKRMHRWSSPRRPPRPCERKRRQSSQRGALACRCNIRRDSLAQTRTAAPPRIDPPTSVPGLTRPHLRPLLRRDRLAHDSPTSAPGLAAKSTSAPGLQALAGAANVWHNLPRRGTVCSPGALVGVPCRALHCMRRRRAGRRPIVPWKHGACPESWRRCGRFSRAGRAACRSRRRCGRGAPSPGADVGSSR
jgi:hypothetical protein